MSIFVRLRGSTGQPLDGMDLADLFQQLAIALGLGLLVGFQRERTDSRLAGFRTFPLIVLFGAVCGLLARSHGGWILAAGLGAIALLIVAGNFSGGRREEREPPGVTTEAALLLMFAVGACLVEGLTAIAIAIGGTVAVLLHLKPEMHALAAKIGDRDFRAIMQFALISLVILPVLPNRAFGPYAVLNPYKIWLMVVLIVGVSLGGYIAFKFAGTRGGALAGGILGGLVSSTATTVGWSRRSRETPAASVPAAFVILVASAIVFVRVAVLIAATAPAFAWAAAPSLAFVFVVLSALSVWCWPRKKSTNHSPPIEPGNPSELRPALIFALLYAGVLLAVAAAKDYFGERGLYIAALLSGLTDMDAITLSVAQMVNNQQVPPDTGWRLILSAAMANLVFKTGVVAVLGSRLLLFRIAVSFLVALIAGVVVFVVR
jgi:uncharacterized membrane protein (DUF4010 family)